MWNLRKIFDAKSKEVFKCKCCGKVYNEMPLTFGNDKPDYYYAIPPDERAERIELRESLCVVDDTHFFHRGRLTIPIKDYPEDLNFDVWSSISEVNFRLRNELWNDPLRVNQQPYFGWLQSIIPTYGETLNLKLIAHESAVGLIPSFELGEEGHPLTEDQQAGISFDKAKAIVQQILAGQHSGK